MKKEPTSTHAKHAKLSYRNGARQLPVHSVTVVRSVVAHKSGNDLTSVVSFCSNTSSLGYSASSHRTNCRRVLPPVRGVTKQLGAGILYRSLRPPAKYTTPLSLTASVSAHWSVSLLGLPNMSLPGTGPAGNPRVPGASCWLPYRHQALPCVTARKVFSWPLPGVGLRRKIQRCTFHIWLNVRGKLTLSPKTEAGQDLLRLTRALWQVHTEADAATWEQQFQAWENQYNDFVKQRTYVRDPKPNQRRWWYTHGRLRSAYRQLKKLQEDQQLFTYVYNSTPRLPRTTNHMEGGINSQLRTKLKLHRGMSDEHQRRLVEWYLYSRTEGQKPTRNFL